MNTSPWSTRIAARVARGGFVVGAFVVSGLLAWLASDDFSDFAADDPVILGAVPIVVAVLTQIAGHLAGKPR